MMQVLLKDNKVIALIARAIMFDPKEDLEVKSVYEVIDYFYGSDLKQEDDVFAIMYDSPCEDGEEKSYYEQQSFMHYYVSDKSIYNRLSAILVEDRRQQEYADTYLGAV
jgi:hypothetical protein